ncbi:MAG: YggS family pyridoxal phosphate-dependent enzyme [Dehalococcoidia bacterium]
MDDRPLAERVIEVRRRVIAACDRAGRDPGDVRIVAVSKTHPIEAVAEAMREGIEEFGENRTDELVEKALAADAAGLTPVWHFVGHLQRNKARDTVPHIDTLHSLDSVRLIQEIEQRWPDAEQGQPAHAGDRLPCYLEVNVAGEAQKHGVSPQDLPALLEAARASSVLRVDGLMTLAPQVRDPEDARPVFHALRRLAEEHGLTGLSMGMTDDFEVAIEEGATVIRIGRAIFGDRIA